MLNKLHVFMGLKDVDGEFEATTSEKITVYGMYAYLIITTVLLINIA